MGLEEKRLVHEGQEKVLPSFTKEIETLIGAKVPVEIDWKSMENDKQALLYYEHNGLDTICSAIRSIVDDEVGKSAFKKAVKKIKIQNVPEATQKKIKIENGALNVKMAWGKDIPGWYSEVDIRKE